MVITFPFWNALAPNYPFNCHFRDDEMQSYYESEQRLAGVFGETARRSAALHFIRLFVAM